MIAHFSAPKASCQSCSTLLDHLQKHCHICGQLQFVQTSFLQTCTSHIPAPIFKRILACILDYSIISVWFLILDQVFVMEYQHLFVLFSYFSQDAVLQWGIPYLAVSLCYFVLFHCLCGTSPGKWVYGLVFYSSSSFLMFWRFVLREACFILLMSLFVIPLLFIFLSKRKRGVHDWISGMSLYIQDHS